MKTLTVRIAPTNLLSRVNKATTKNLEISLLFKNQFVKRYKDDQKISSGSLHENT